MKPHATSINQRLLRGQAPSYERLQARLAEDGSEPATAPIAVHCGWGRLLIGHTFPDAALLAEELLSEQPGERDIALYVAAPQHPIHQEPEPLSEVTRVKYRGVAVADTARERPVLTVQLLDKQPRLTVSTIEDKRQALLAGLGVATMPYPLVERDIAEGRLRVVSPEYTSEVDIIMAWRRDSMGEGKSWCLREIPKLFAGK